MYCPNCGTENKEESIYCNLCQEPLQKYTGAPAAGATPDGSTHGPTAGTHGRSAGPGRVALQQPMTGAAVAEPTGAAR